MEKKSPVSILQEMLSRQRITPTYELVTIVGAHHAPTFRYRVWYGEKEGKLSVENGEHLVNNNVHESVGHGKSKKAAKQSAAQLLIDKITGVSGGEAESATLDSNIDDLSSSLKSNVYGNQIGWLQELATANRWQPPMYVIERELGLVHERQFVVACLVNKYKEVGQGKTKKIAKRLAANKMWKKLNKTSGDAIAETSSVNTNGANYVQLVHEFLETHKLKATELYQILHPLLLITNN